MKSAQFEEFKQTFNLDEFRDYFYTHSEKETVAEYGLSYGNLKSLQKEYDLHIPKEIIAQRKKATGAATREVKYKDLHLLAPKDLFIQYYIEENHSLLETSDYFKISQGQVISIMTFAKPRYNKNFEYELIRYCSSKHIIGGAEKLFKHFVELYDPQSIISYCDLSKFTGQTYLKLGFTFKSCISGRHGYHYKFKQHITDNLLRQRGFDQLFGTSFGKGSSNEELILNAGFLDVYDAGQATYTGYKKTSER